MIQALRRSRAVVLLGALSAASSASAGDGLPGLAAASATRQRAAEAAFAAGDYTAALTMLAALRAPVDAFFDGVMVNTDDAALRANRLGLLATLHLAMNRVADISRLSA
mgnify:CR=1 FL=1